MIREKTFAAMKIGDIMSLIVETPSTITRNAPVKELLETVIEDTKTRHVYVTDDSNKLIGVVRMTKVVEYLFPFTSMLLHATDMTLGNMQSIKAQTVEEVMDDTPLFVGIDSPISDAARILMTEKINELPVVNSAMELIGQINVYEFITAYLNKQREHHENI